MLQALIGPVTGLLDKFIPDADQKAKLAHEIATMSEKHAQEALLAQLKSTKQKLRAVLYSRAAGAQQLGGSARLLSPITLS